MRCAAAWGEYWAARQRDIQALSHATQSEEEGEEDLERRAFTSAGHRL